MTSMPIQPYAFLSACAGLLLLMSGKLLSSALGGWAASGIVKVIPFTHLTERVRSLKPTPHGPSPSPSSPVRLSIHQTSSPQGSEPELRQVVFRNGGRIIERPSEGEM